MRYALAIALAALLISLSDWLFFGVLFHDRYDKTPEVWRVGPEGPKIAWSIAISLIGIIGFFALGSWLDVRGVRPALFLALIVWLVASLPQTLTNTMYLRYAPEIGFSHSLGWLARVVIAAAGYGIVAPSP